MIYFADLAYLLGHMGRINTKSLLLKACILLAGFFFAGLLTLFASLDASAANNTDCANQGGSWSGINADEGTCTYPANSTEALNFCGADQQYTITYDSDGQWTTLCTAIVSSPASLMGYGGCGTEVRGPLEHRVTLALCHNRNGAATFPTGSCFIKCTISPGLPAAAARKLPGSSYATIYVRSVAPGGEAGQDSYAVCFNLDDLGLDAPTIYRFISGSWEAVAIGNAESRVLCAAGSGDGSFYLGQPNTKKTE